KLRKLAHIMRKYDRGYGHFTTRTNLQLHWIKLEDTPDILAELASVEMHAIQTSGNSFRNTTTDPFAGVAADELEDPRPYAEIIRQWATLHPEFSFLPRKFKIAICASKEDRAAVKMHDLGLYLHERSGRARLRGGGRRRARPHALSRADGQGIRAAARHPLLYRGLPARLQPLRPARQSVEGAHQDSDAEPRRPEIRRGGRAGMARLRPRGDRGPRDLYRRDRRSLRAAGLRPQPGR